MRALLGAAVLLGMIAGCAEGAAPPVEDEFDDLGGNVTSTTGLVRGVVFTTSIVPIEGATVRIAAAERVTTTNAEGTFVIDGLRPGSYFLEVSRLGYVPVQVAAQVEAGVERPDIVKIQMMDDAAFRPERTTVTYEGRLQCSFTLVVVGFNACGLAEIADMPLDNPLVVFDVSGNVSWLQTEMVWDSTQPLGDGLELMYSWGDCDGFFCDHEVAGPSPLTLTADSAQARKMLDDPADPERPGLMVRVFGTESAQAQGTGLGATLDQGFTHYTTVFKGFLPDEGWTFFEQGEHPLPA